MSLADRNANTEHAIVRTTVPALESILGHAYPVIDHGMIRVIDYMGDQAAVVQMARVSYGVGTDTPSSDRGLLRYLFSHRHTSPFEGCEIKLHIKLPIFIARQWLRHRTACLAGDVVVSFDLPGGRTNSTEYRHHPLTMKEIYDRFQRSHDRARPNSLRNHYHKRDRVMNMKLRSCNEDTGEIYHTNVVDIWECGIKPILRVKFDNGGVLRATKDHLCFTDKGWLRLEDALSIGASFATVGRKTGYVSEPNIFDDDDLESEVWQSVEDSIDYEVSSLGRVRRMSRMLIPTITDAGYQVVSVKYGNTWRTRFVHHLVLESFDRYRLRGEQTRHLNNNRQDNRLSNLRYGTPLENAADRMNGGTDQGLVKTFTTVCSWEWDGKEMTYDMEVRGPYHNFIGGGVVVHNSVNEYSARYSILSDEFYFPELEQVKYQSQDNKQGRSESIPEEAALAVVDLIKDTSTTCYRRYSKMVDDNIARELARIGLTLNTYTEMYWKIDLHNLLNFLRLRFDKHAQYEIRVYAELMFDIVKEWVPDIARAFIDYSLEARTFSRMEIETLGKIMRGEPVVQQGSGMSKREWKDFMSFVDGLKQTADSNGPTPFQTIPSEEIEKHDITA